MRTTVVLCGCPPSDPPSPQPPAWPDPTTAPWCLPPAAGAGAAPYVAPAARELELMAEITKLRVDLSRAEARATIAESKAEQASAVAGIVAKNLDLLMKLLARDGAT